MGVEEGLLHPHPPPPPRLQKGWLLKLRAFAEGGWPRFWAEGQRPWQVWKVWSPPRFLHSFWFCYGGSLALAAASLASQTIRGKTFAGPRTPRPRLPLGREGGGPPTHSARETDRCCEDRTPVRHSLTHAPMHRSSFWKCGRQAPFFPLPYSILASPSLHHSPLPPPPPLHPPRRLHVRMLKDPFPPFRIGKKRKFAEPAKRWKRVIIVAAARRMPIGANAGDSWYLFFSSPLFCLQVGQAWDLRAWEKRNPVGRPEWLPVDCPYAAGMNDMSIDPSSQLLPRGEKMFLNR